MSGWLGNAAAQNRIRDLVRTESVRGTPVFTCEGTQTGIVEDLVISKESGQVAYVLISCGGLLGLGAKDRPLPWRLLSFSIKDGGYVLNVPEEFLLSAPTYDDTSALSVDFASRVEDHYIRGKEPPILNT